MKRGSMRGMGRRRVAMVGAAAAVTLALGAGITSAYAERVILNADGQVVEQDQPDATGQEGIEVVDGTAESGEGKTTELGLAEADESKKDAGDTAAEGDQQVEGEKKADDDAPKGPKVAPQLEVRGPKVSGDPNAKYPSIDAPKVVINDPKRDYIDESGEPATSPVGCKDLSGSKTGWLPLKGGWYCFTKSATLEGRAAVEGDVRIILCDGAKVTWNGGLHLCAGSKLTIYGQKEGTGELVADASECAGDAGIGGNKTESSTDVTICGGHVTAKGGYYGAGIGGGTYIWHPFKSNEPAGNCGKVTIYGGDIEAYGGFNAAGIGSGGTYAPSGGTVTIKGGRVAAKGRASGAGIGGGYAGKSCDLVLIENATVIAVSGNTGAGIGGGGAETGTEGSPCDGGKVIIRNANVTTSSVWGAGIGGGGDTHGAKGGDLTIEGASTVRCHSGDGAAIGRGVEGPEDGNGRLSIPDDMRVVTLDADDGVSEEDRDAGKGKPVPVAERVSYCHYRNDVLLEPCKHEATTCEQVEGGHQPHCKHCKTEFETRDHCFDLDGRCGECGYVRPMPKFVSPTWEASDGAKLVFRVEEPEDHKAVCEGARMEISVGGKKGRTITIDRAEAKADAEGRRLYPVGLTAIEMAEPVRATLTYGGGATVEQEVPLTALLDGDATSSDAGRAALARALANAGHWLQRHLSVKKGWKLGTDYADIRLSYDGELDVDSAGAALEGFAVRSDKGGSKFKGVTMSVTFGSTASVDIHVSCKPGTKDFSAETNCEGATKPVLEADGRYHIHIDGISPKDFGKNLQVAGNADGGFRIDLSVLSYANACFHKEGAKPDEKAAMAAVYRLWKACQ